jgi:outer membrane murein-binding lipoprotein Lpp
MTGSETAEEKLNRLSERADRLSRRFDRLAEDMRDLRSEIDEVVNPTKKKRMPGS